MTPCDTESPYFIVFLQSLLYFSFQPKKLHNIFLVPVWFPSKFHYFTLCLTFQQPSTWTEKLAIRFEFLFSHPQKKLWANIWKAKPLSETGVEEIRRQKFHRERKRMNLICVFKWCNLPFYLCCQTALLQRIRFPFSRVCIAFSYCAEQNPSREAPEALLALNRLVFFQKELYMSSTELMTVLSRVPVL